MLSTWSIVPSSYANLKYIIKYVKETTLDWTESYMKSDRNGTTENNHVLVTQISKFYLTNNTRVLAISVS